MLGNKPVAIEPVTADFMKTRRVWLCIFISPGLSMLDIINFSLQDFGNKKTIITQLPVITF